MYTLKDAICAGGYLVVTSLWVEDVAINLNELVFTEKNIVGSICYNGTDFDEVIELLSSGKLQVPGYITKKIHLDDLVEEGFKTLIGPEKKKQVKILVTPERELL